MKLWITERGIDMKTLKDVSIGQTVKVKKLTGEGPVKRRIMDPVEVTVRGYELSLRKADAEIIEVE